MKEKITQKKEQKNCRKRQKIVARNVKYKIKQGKLKDEKEEKKSKTVWTITME